jgi:hypothetical protein
MTESAINSEDTTVKQEEGLVVNGLYNLNGTVCIAINPTHLSPLFNANGSTLHKASGAENLMADPGTDEWVDRMTRFRTRVLTDLSNDRSERDRLQTYVTDLGAALLAEAERREWCEEYDAFAEEWGLPKMASEYEVTITVKVQAKTEEEATELVEQQVSLSSYSHAWILDGPDYSTSEA